MKRTHLIPAFVGFVAVCILAADASAYYHPGMGRFMSRDPGAGSAARIGAGGPAAQGGFIPRDPTGQYADGTNLYQSVRSNPVRYVDPMGLWGEDTHTTLTRQLVANECPQIAEQVANANQEMDNAWHEAPPNVIFSLLSLGLATLFPGHQADYNYHMPGAGPVIPFVPQNKVEYGLANDEVARLYAEVIHRKNSPKRCDVQEFGRFLHMLQDSYSHGGGVPDLGGHPKGVLLQSRDPETGEIITAVSEGVFDTRCDDPAINAVKYQAMEAATKGVIEDFKANCPCTCQGKGKD